MPIPMRRPEPGCIRRRVEGAPPFGEPDGDRQREGPAAEPDEDQQPVRHADGQGDDAERDSIDYGGSHPTPRQGA
jgi:hypothetical protein